MLFCQELGEKIRGINPVIQTLARKGMKKRSEFPKKTIPLTVLVFEGCGVSKQILRGHPGTFVNTVSYQYCPYVKELFSQESLLFLDVCRLKKN